VAKFGSIKTVGEKQIKVYEETLSELDFNAQANMTYSQQVKEVKKRKSKARA
jgi:hypothetical protein|tara:strand:- start:326 stop:481 length:156 start_codon:yes stop_codon:yes gene_type:complete